MENHHISRNDNNGQDTVVEMEDLDQMDKGHYIIPVIKL